MGKKTFKPPFPLPDELVAELKAERAKRAALEREKRGRMQASKAAILAESRAKRRNTLATQRTAKRKSLAAGQNTSAPGPVAFSASTTPFCLAASDSSEALPSKFEDWGLREQGAVPSRKELMDLWAMPSHHVRWARNHPWLTKTAFSRLIRRN